MKIIKEEAASIAGFKRLVHQHSKTCRNTRYGKGGGTIYKGRFLQSRPDSAIASRHVGKITNDESVVIGLVAHKADAIAAWAGRRDHVCIIDSEIDLIVLDLVQAISLRLSLREVSHEAASRIGDLIRREQR